MKVIDTSLLPFPHYNNGKRLNGSILHWPEYCLKCRQNTCKIIKDTNLSLCSHGYNFLKIDNNIILAGFLIRDFPNSSSARKKRMSTERNNAISKEMLNRTVLSIQGYTGKTYQEIEREKKRIVREYVEKNQYKTDFLQPLKTEIQKGLSFVHDYKQINTQIRQNINVIIESNYEGESLERKLDVASREEKAIYAASKFLDEKLNVAKFLIHPEWLYKKDECVKYSFHGIVIKYRGIYAIRIESKNIQVSISGNSYIEILAHPQAVSVIPHTLIDNAAKYSPRGGKIEIYVQDTKERTINFLVSSFGPLIKPNELNQIFKPFFRTESAKQIEEEGAGYGLYISQMIARKHLGTKINVTQDTSNKFENCYWTTFSIEIPSKAAILP